jgi:hypothetical protein
VFPHSIVKSENAGLAGFSPPGTSWGLQVKFEKMLGLSNAGLFDNAEDAIDCAKRRYIFVPITEIISAVNGKGPVNPEFSISAAGILYLRNFSDKGTVSIISQSTIFAVPLYHQHGILSIPKRGVRLPLSLHLF